MRIRIEWYLHSMLVRIIIAGILGTILLAFFAAIFNLVPGPALFIFSAMMLTIVLLFTIMLKMMRDMIWIAMNYIRSSITIQNILQDPYISFGGWCIGPDNALILVETILYKKPDLVVELGAGASTILIATALEKNGAGKLISFEENETHHSYVQSIIKEKNLSNWVDLVIAPLKNISDIADSKTPASLWYDGEIIRKVLGNQKIDVLFVDGPSTTNSRYIRRSTLPMLSSYLAHRGIVLFDDGDRRGELEIIHEYKKTYAHYNFEHILTEKGLWKIETAH